MSSTQSEPTPQTRRLRVFLCHWSGDKPFVRTLYSRLKEDGFDPWLDKEELLPGQEWQEEISVAVRASDVVIVCVSKKSVEWEGYLQREIRDALYVAEEKREGTIFIIPARIEDVEVPRRLSKWQWANLFEEDGYRRLVAALGRRARSLGLSIPSCELAPVSIQENFIVPAGHPLVHEQTRAGNQPGKQGETSVPQSLPMSADPNPGSIALQIPADGRQDLEPPRSRARILLYAISIVLLCALAGIIAVKMEDKGKHSGKTNPSHASTIETIPPIPSNNTSDPKDNENSVTDNIPNRDSTSSVGKDAPCYNVTSADAMFKIGKDYHYGHGVRQDYHRAYSCYERAASRGNRSAMNNLGLLYMEGHGVVQDYKQARQWFEQAAAKGNALAMGNIGILYYKGWGVAQDYDKAREWFEKATVARNRHAMVALGFLYESGLGVTQDYKQARMWYQKAADAGNEDAKMRLQGLPN